MKGLAEETQMHEFTERIGISQAEIAKLHEKSFLNGVQRDSTRVRFRVQGKMMERLLAKNQVLMDVILRQAHLKTNTFYFPNLLMVTDNHGVILTINGDERSILQAANLNNIGIGSSLSLSSAGTNAVSAAIDLQRPVWISGEDHYLDTMHNWVTMCVPIQPADHQIIGYLVLTAFEHISAPFMYPCIKSIALLLEYELRKTELQSKTWFVEEMLEERLKAFKLTLREKEVATYWLLDYDYKQIGKVLGISENTVRVYVTKINRKLKVNSKASLILSVLGAI
ncbi:LuxR C-terminal-related transcriptional regulator [Paenibacillus qinlingensis]|uniref:Transcriptional regulator of acetoin/glycerol metabolism n=1 Tax=Paenibacillus qinlingensis TaxID=1837343 RepID=A0ABU1NPY8_9BACL|nr:LuxR C-terminal-related transcriptional regulator [Paenibacillus qinlingensis]MDR6549535.1 transcriptional regulator of acetoin/glycerol metabolism [Paenibacillus qinlingensis]